MRRSVGSAAAAVALSLVALGVASAPAGATAGAPAPAEPKRGQATVVFAIYPAVVDGGRPITTPSRVWVRGGVRYADGSTWKPRRGALVKIQKRTAAGAWVTIDEARTGWSADDTSPGGLQLVEDRNVPSVMSDPDRRCLRLYVPGNTAYQAVTSVAVDAYGLEPSEGRGIPAPRRC